MDNSVIRFATRDDIPALMQFIDKYWKKGHILATNRELFDWQYINYNQVNFVLGCNFNNDIEGVLGYIPYDETDKKDIALALWKANHVGSPFMGIEMLTYLIKEELHTTIVCSGINLDTTSKIYQYYGMSVGTMTQWYRLRRMKKYNIAIIENDIIPITYQSRKCNLKLFENFIELEESFDYEKYKRSGLRPFKSKTYLQKRYFNHPAYDYKVFGVMRQDDVAISIIVLRIQEYNGAKIIRFVDCIGDITCISFITGSIDKLLQQYDAEYIDMYEVGVSEDIMLNAGWLKVRNSENIIPNYFSPFQQCNVDIHYCSSDKEVVLFKGDGDQDRPN